VPRRAVFLDRDGVLVRATVGAGVPHPPAALHELELLPGVVQACHSLRSAGFVLIVVTNQPDIARRTTTAAQVAELNRAVQERVPIDEIMVCPHDDADECPCRKPRPGMLLAASERWDVALDESYLVGDRWRDVEAARAAGCRAVFVDLGYPESLVSEPDATVRNLEEAATWILRQVNTKAVAR
jgi:D-glycero-D-manno-heptose 1,7-bisphosphate phosphatase